MCATGGENNLELWFWPAPPTGTVSLSATLAGTANGASAISVSYGGTTATTIDVPAMGNGSSTSPVLSWTPSPSARWAIAALMDQGGFLMALTPTASQATRSVTICDPNDWTAQLVADQTSLGTGAVGFTWTFGSGTYGTGQYCGLDSQAHNWIALGASLQ
jgi:hypothetical protein